MHNKVLIDVKKLAADTLQNVRTSFVQVIIFI